MGRRRHSRGGEPGARGAAAAMVLVERSVVVVLVVFGGGVGGRGVGGRRGQRAFFASGKKNKAQTRALHDFPRPLEIYNGVGFFLCVFRRLFWSAGPLT